MATEEQTKDAFRTILEAVRWWEAMPDWAMDGIGDSSLDALGLYVDSVLLWPEAEDLAKLVNAEERLDDVLIAEFWTELQKKHAVLQD